MKTTEFKRATIRQFLSHPESYGDLGWFYLPPDPKTWTLDTEGVFSFDSIDFEPDSDESLPPQAKEKGWVEALNADIAEEIVSYAREEVSDPTDDQLFSSFVYYYENDAFLTL